MRRASVRNKNWLDIWYTRVYHSAIRNHKNYLLKKLTSRKFLYEPKKCKIERLPFYKKPYNHKFKFFYPRCIKTLITRRNKKLRTKLLKRKTLKLFLKKRWRFFVTPFRIQIRKWKARYIGKKLCIRLLVKFYKLKSKLRKKKLIEPYQRLKFRFNFNRSKRRLKKFFLYKANRFFIWNLVTTKLPRKKNYKKFLYRRIKLKTVNYKNQKFTHKIRNLVHKIYILANFKTRRSFCFQLKKSNYSLRNFNQKLSHVNSSSAILFFLGDLRFETNIKSVF